MDPSQSKSSHPASDSSSIPVTSSSESDSVSTAGLHSGSTGESSSSVGNCSPEQSSYSGDTSSSMMTTSSDEDDDMPSDQSTPSKLQTGSSTTTMAARSRREGRAGDIGLLIDLHNLRNKTGRYAFSGDTAQREFCKFWIKEENEFANKQELDKKIEELHARFLKNMDKNVQGPTDPIDVEILRLSHWIWGAEIDSADDHKDSIHVPEDSIKDSKHSPSKDHSSSRDGSPAS